MHQSKEYLVGVSAPSAHHSTETALLRVLSDIYAAADRKDVTLLGLLDLSAAFDCASACSVRHLRRRRP